MRRIWCANTPRGASLWKFARRTLKHPPRYAQLLAYNPGIRNPRRIIAGRTILVPDGLLKDRLKSSKIVLNRWVVRLPDSMMVRAGPTERAASPEPAVPSPEAAAVPERAAPTRAAPSGLEEPERLFHLGRYEEAVGRLESFLRSAADARLRARAEFLLAECYRMLGGGL